MNWTWATSLDQLWRSQTFPMWLTLAAAGFFALILLLTLLRADRSVANGALTVITLLAIGVAVTATLRGFVRSDPDTAPDRRPPLLLSASLPALSCLDDLAGDSVGVACEKVVFGSADSTAAAVSYAATQITRLIAFGDVGAANRNLTPELQALRRAVERDRYGLIAYVLTSRDRCKPSDCAAFQSLTDHNQISANMEERTYEGQIARFASSWNAPAVPVATGQSSLPTGKPTTAEFPTSASIPPISIMTPEPPAAPPPVAAAPAPRPAAAPANAQAASSQPRPPQAAAKKPPAPKTRAPATAAAPVQLAPAAKTTE